MTKEEKAMFQKGFKVALNFLFHHQLDAAGKDDPAKKEKFKQFLLSTTNTKKHKEIVEEAINLKSTMEGSDNCGSGFCPDGNGGCVRCAFEFAFNGTFHS